MSLEVRHNGGQLPRQLATMRGKETKTLVVDFKAYLGTGQH